ncbi:MAG: DNA translocase FtsK 4TM domain-containing protein [Gammaproteobacteria bacterium]|nr:DNA translocase FtsK 4TM domain-containing protein [Gammaproteobacteria bacterium]
MARQLARTSENKANKEESSNGLSKKQIRGLREVALILLSAVAIFLFSALITYNQTDPAWSHSTLSNDIQNAGGIVGAWFADITFFLFGYLAYFFPLGALFLGWRIFRGKKIEQEANGLQTFLVVFGAVLVIATSTGISSMHFADELNLLPANSGGALGSAVATTLSDVFNPLGATLAMLALLLTGMGLMGMSWLKLMDVTGAFLVDRWLRFKEYQEDRRIAKANVQAREESVKQEKVKTAKRKAPKIAKPDKKPAEISIRAIKAKQIPLFKDHDSRGNLPSLGLLDEPVATKHKMSEEALAAMARQVELKLREFNIEVHVHEVLPGPVITRYEIMPAPGVKSAAIVNLAKDLARSLSVQSVRVVDVIPGKSVIGIEIPNEHREIVRLIEIFQSKAYEKATSPLALGLGKDISGNPVVADLAKMPHLLVAGTTGSGKSVAVNAMILSLLYNATPEQVRMIMIDPKMLELSIYDGIPHLLTPVVTDMSDASAALRWCVAEMERRYKLMSALGVRNIGGYNRKVRDAIDEGDPIRDPLHKPENPEPAEELKTLPYIVIVVDELADMMMVVGKKVEELIARLAQKARAAGIHLILATQRPSVDVLTGLIKANVPTRIAFQVSSKIDSRTVIDQMGAEQLLGHGDMLYMAAGTGLPQRVHGAFVDDPEVHRVVEDLKSRGEPDYDESILEGDMIADIGMGASDSGSPTSDDPEQDPLYDQAVQIVIETRKASISSVQRRLKIGYNRAANLVEAMERAGLVSAPGHNGQREVIVPEQMG